MNEITNPKRVYRLIKDSISKFELDLTGLTVMTEAASGAYVVSPLIAALAGADVISIARDTSYGNASDVIDYTKRHSDALGVSTQIKLTDESPVKFASTADIVMNQGNVRPIDSGFIDLMKPGAVIPLGVDTWEFRESDMDLPACRTKGIPVLGTRETDKRLQTFRYVGLTAVKILHTLNIEITLSNILLIAGGHFGKEINSALSGLGATVLQLDPQQGNISDNSEAKDFIKKCDAIVVAEHPSPEIVIGGKTGLPVSWIQDYKDSIQLVHICGGIDQAAISEVGIEKHPSRTVEPMVMAVTTDYVGPRPVVDLVTASMKVGQELHRALKESNSVGEAVTFALNNSPAVDFS